MNRTAEAYPNLNKLPLGNGSGFESLAAHHVLAKAVGLE